MFNQFFGEDRAKRMAQLVIIALSLFSLFLLVKVVANFKSLPNIGKEVYPKSTIAVSGIGEAYAIPDIATFSFSTNETAATVKDAQQKSDTKINGALAAVKEVGVEDKDIQTTSYNVYPKYEYSSPVCPKPAIGGTSAIYCPPGKQILTGYEVSQTITVKVRDTGKVGDLVTKVGATGVSNISGIQFEVDNKEQYEAQARERAITNAKAKAKVLAKDLGVKLGDILYYNEGGNYPVYSGAMGMGGSDEAKSVAPRVAEVPQGQTKIISNVSITYELK